MRAEGRRLDKPIATDAAARARFRRYWAFASPGIALIRQLSLHPLKRAAEHRAQMRRHGESMIDAV